MSNAPMTGPKICIDNLDARMHRTLVSYNKEYKYIVLVLVSYSYCVVQVLGVQYKNPWS